MSTGTASVIDPETRLFRPFLDPVDMVGLFPAETSVAEVNREAARHGLRFPLFLDPQRTLREHFAIMDYAPASARFGAVVDNVPGMNWNLPGGRRVRVGERVIKSATGYDLLRFLLHADDRYGQAAEYVLRLRPLAGETFQGIFRGDAEALANVVKTLRGSSWNHWIDAVEWVFSDEEPWLGVTVDCLAGESRKFAEFFSKVAESGGAEFSAESAETIPGLPRFSIKSLPGRVGTLAGECQESLGGQIRALPLNGVLLVYPGREPDDDGLRNLREHVEGQGGHILGLPQTPDESETPWSTTLEDAWRNL